MVQCPYCGDYYTLAKLTAHKQECFENKYTKSVSESIRSRSVAKRHKSNHSNDVITTPESLTIPSGTTTIPIESGTTSIAPSSSSLIKHMTENSFSILPPSQQQNNTMITDYLSDNNEPYDDGDYYDCDVMDDDPVQFICTLADPDKDEDNIIDSPQINNEETSGVTNNINSCNNNTSGLIFDPNITEEHHMGLSEEFSLELLKIIDEFVIPRAAHERLVKLINNIVTASKSQFGTNIFFKHVYM